MARQLLCETPIPCDCLLLLTGAAPGEIAVIERTPTRYALRPAADESVCVTNSYLALDAAAGRGVSEILTKGSALEIPAGFGSQKPEVRSQ